MEQKNALRKIIREILISENSWLIEGVDIDLKNKIVSFSPTHEKNVDTSTILNPTETVVNGIPIISIFKRKRSEEFAADGNPLIYALKGIDGWKFRNPQQDIIGLLRQFIRISEKIKSEYDTIITVPSSNPLNVEFLRFHSQESQRASVVG
jgi:hypothetical protein